METIRNVSFIILVVGLSACSPERQDAIEGVDGLGSRDAAARNGGREDGSVTAPHLDPEPLGYGVVAGDYTVTSISVLDSDGTPLQRDFINSGSATTGLVTALSGDVALPTRSGDPGILTIIDRFRTDVITRIDLASGEVLGQVKTHEPNSQDDENAFSSNPHDYIYLDESTAWVTRFEPNPGASEDDPDQGIDLLRIDPTGFMRTAERIDLNPLNGTAERMNPDTGETEEVIVYARPSRMVRLGSYVVVGISSLSLTFDAAGKGMVALVDLETKRARGFELPGLQNCGSVAPVPDDDRRVAVACTGFHRTVPRDTAGLAVLVLQDGELEAEHVWRAKDDPDSALTMYSPVALSATEIVAVAAGEEEVLDGDGQVERPATNDRLYRVDLETSAQHEVFEADGRYVIGSGAFNPRRRILLVPDASTDGEGRPTGGVKRFERTDSGELEPLDVIEIDDILPSRQVMPL